MKKVKILIAGLTGIITMYSCSKKIDAAFRNPNAATRQPIETLLPNVIQNMAVSNTAQGTLYGTQNDGQYTGRYVQFWATNTAANQYDQMGGAIGASDILGSVWAMHYYGMGQNVSRIIEWGTEEKKWDYVGVAQAIRAWSWLTLTDMYGEVILKDAFNTSILVFRYDTQEEVYEEVKRLAKEAIVNLSKTGDGVSAANLAKGDQFFYGGDVEKWKKFANTVLARVYHRTTNKANYKADSVIHYANLGIIENVDNAYVKFAGVSTITMSYYGPTRGNVGTFRQTKFVADLLSGVDTVFKGVEDPRAWYILRENTNMTFKGIRPAKGVEVLPLADQPQNFFGGAYAVSTGSAATARYVFRDAMPWPVMTAAETRFMKAEAQYRSGQKPAARTTYMDAIRTNIDMLNTDYSTNVPVARIITPAQKEAFVTNPIISPATISLGHIMLQKYIASYGYGMIETWVDMRRYHYTDKETGFGTQVYGNFTPPSGSDLFVNNNNGLVYRARPRYNSEYLYNVDALTTIGALDPTYHTKRPWFTEP